MTSKGLWVGLLLTLVFLFLAFRGVDPAELGAALARANYWFVLPALLATGLGYVTRTARWRAILSAEAPMPFSRLFRVLLIGFAANNVLPARLGEFIRAVLLQRHGGVRKSFALATIFLERVADGLTLLLILVVLSSAGLIPGVNERFEQMELLTAIVFVGLSIGIGLALARRDLAVRLVSTLARPLPTRISSWANSIFAGFMDGIDAMRSPRRLLSVGALSLLVWGLEAISYFVLTFAFDLPLNLLNRVVLAGTVLVLVNLSIMIPSAPGYIGTVHFVASSTLRLFGVPAEVALAYAIVAHALQYVLVTSAGVVSLGREHLTWRSLMGKEAPTSRYDRPARAEERSESLVP